MSNITALISELESLNSKISTLKTQKEDIESLLITNLGHETIGQKSYILENEYKVSITTKFNYRLDKEAYESLRADLSVCVVNERKAYDIDKRKLLAYEETENLEALNEIAQFISKSLAKPYVKIKHIGEE